MTLIPNTASNFRNLPQDVVDYIASFLPGSNRITHISRAFMKAVFEVRSIKYIDQPAVPHLSMEWTERLDICSARGVCLNTLRGHTNWIQSIAFSPDGQYLASGSDDHTIRLWDVKKGAHLNTLRGHTNSVQSIAFSPDGQSLASGSTDHLLDPEIHTRQTFYCEASLLPVLLTRPWSLY